MQGNIIRTFFIVLIFLFYGIHAKRSSTCRDLERARASREAEIESVKLALEEYEFSRGEDESKPDECNGYSTCSKCLREKTNPACGWCSLRSKCSLRENCPGSESSPDLWISGSDRCPKIRAVKPHVLAARTASMLEIIIPHLPEYDGIFLCSFEVLGKRLLTKGKKMEKGITCASPRSDNIPEVPKESDHLPVKLSIRIPKYSIASTTNLTIYDCGRYASCSECAASPFPCAWCIEGNRCTHNVNEYCRNDIIVFSKAIARATIREGPAYCTRFSSMLGYNEILVPSGIKKRIQVKVENLAMFQVASRFICKVRGLSLVTAQVLGDIVYCDVMEFKVLNRSPITNLSLDIYWDGGTTLIDNIQNIHVVVYHCGLMASSCGECLDLPDKYICGWCEESNSCTIRDNCGDSWMDRKQTCTKPEITSFYPKSGMWTQRTNITIKGINFGKDFKGVDSVRLMNEEGFTISECTPLEHLFIKHSQIVCELSVPETFPEGNETLQGFFEVKISNSFVTVSEEKYSFVDPSITGLEPVKGMKSGGTFLKIKGHNLDAGNKVEAFIGDLPCNIVSREFSTLLCRTSPSPRTRSDVVRVLFDGEERTSPVYFFYVEDPYIRSVKSETGADGPVGTLSGGNTIIVEGEYFDHVPNPYIYIILDGVEYPGDCTASSEKLMKCSSPRIPTDSLNFCGEEGFMAFDYGFRMGNVEDVQNISFNRIFKKFRIHPDPLFVPFAEEGKTKIYEADYVTINGKYLNAVFDEEAFSVHIGDEECVLTSLSPTQLTCKPPATQPKARDGDGNKLPEVVVTLHKQYEYFIGFLRYIKKLTVF